jgi:hypothetical protein
METVNKVAHQYKPGDAVVHEGTRDVVMWESIVFPEEYALKNHKYLVPAHKLCPYKPPPPRIRTGALMV